jgi:hypothetical protein
VFLRITISALRCVPCSRFARTAARILDYSGTGLFGLDQILDRIRTCGASYFGLHRLRSAHKMQLAGFIRKTSPFNHSGTSIRSTIKLRLIDRIRTCTGLRSYPISANKEPNLSRDASAFQSIYLVSRHLPPQSISLSILYTISAVYFAFSFSQRLMANIPLCNAPLMLSWIFLLTLRHPTSAGCLACPVSC